MSDVESENGEIGETSVLLGYAGRSLSKATALDDRIGGKPVWLGGVEPESHLLRCGVCSSLLNLLCQLNCPIEEENYDRVLYILSCRSLRCQRNEGSIRAILGTHSSEAVSERISKELFSEQEPQQNIGLGDQLFGISTGASFSSDVTKGQNPFATGCLVRAPPVSVQLTTPAVSKTQNDLGRLENNTLSVDVSYAIYAPKEIEVEGEVLIDSKPVINYDDKIGPPLNEKQEKFTQEENSLMSSLADPIFLKFLSILEHNPQQVLRYGRPLRCVPYTRDGLYKTFLNPENLPEGPRGKRQFEVQLMPRLISELETEDMIQDGMEWGTIVVATSCSTKAPPGINYEEQWVGVQWEDRGQ